MGTIEETRSGERPDPGRRGKKLTAVQRLALLLPWLNDATDPYAVSAPDLTQWSARFRGAIGRFLVSFDGSPATGFVEVLRRATGPVPAGYYQPVGLDPDGQVVGFDSEGNVIPNPDSRQRVVKLCSSTSEWKFNLDPGALESLRTELGCLVSVGFDGPYALGPGGGSTLDLPTLRFGVRNVMRADVKLSMLTCRDRRIYEAPGAYVLQVTGSARDLVLYLVLHLLTAERVAGMLARCQAPAPHNWQERCNRWFLRTGHGRRRTSCSDKCGDRIWSEERAKKLKKKDVTAVVNLAAV